MSAIFSIHHQQRRKLKLALRLGKRIQIKVHVYVC